MLPEKSIVVREWLRKAGQENEGTLLRELQKVLELTPTYHTRVNGIPAGPDEAERLFSILPPNKTQNDKAVLGIYLDGEVIGCADVVRDYPNPQTCFLGLLLLREDLQRKGHGANAYKMIEELFRGWGSFKIIRLATVATNSDVEGFWTRMGFQKTGERNQYQQGDVSSECILFEKRLS